MSSLPYLSFYLLIFLISLSLLFLSTLYFSLSSPFLVRSVYLSLHLISLPSGSLSLLPYLSFYFLIFLLISLPFLFLYSLYFSLPSLFFSLDLSISLSFLISLPSLSLSPLSKLSSPLLICRHYFLLVWMGLICLYKLLLLSRPACQSIILLTQLNLLNMSTSSGHVYFSCEHFARNNSEGCLHGSMVTERDYRFKRSKFC